MKRLGILFFFLITVMTFSQVYAGKRDSGLATDGKNSSFFSDAVVELDHRFDAFVTLLKTTIEEDYTRVEAFFNSLASYFPKSHLETLSGSADFSELKAWLESGCGLEGRAITLCQSISAKAAAQLHYLYGSLKTFLRFPQFYLLTFTSREDSITEQTDSGSHDQAMRMLASKLPGGQFHHNLWDDKVTEEETFKKRPVKLYSIVDVMESPAPKRKALLNKMVRSLSPGQMQIVQSSMAILKGNENTLETESTDAGGCLGSCYMALYQSVKRKVKGSGTLRRSHRIMDMKAKAQESENAIGLAKNQLIAELSGIIEKMKRSNLLNLDEGMKPSDIKKVHKSVKWVEVQQAMEEKLRKSMAMYEESKRLAEEEWKGTVKIDTSQLLEECYRDARSGNQGEDETDGPEFNSKEELAAFLRLMVVFSVGLDQLNAANEAKWLASIDSSDSQ